MWKVVLLGIIAALLIALGAVASVLPDPSDSVAAYQQATPCAAASVPSDNCYVVVPVTVVSVSAQHFLRNRQDEEHVIVQAPSGPSEIVLPWERQQDQVLLAGATGTVDVYRGVPVLIAVGGYQFATLQNPVVQRRKPDGSAGSSWALGWCLAARWCSRSSLGGVEHPSRFHHRTPCARRFSSCLQRRIRGSSRR